MWDMIALPVYTEKKPQQVQAQIMIGWFILYACRVNIEYIKKTLIIRTARLWLLKCTKQSSYNPTHRLVELECLLAAPMVNTKTTHSINTFTCDCSIYTNNPDTFNYLLIARRLVGLNCLRAAATVNPTNNQPSRAGICLVVIES